MLEELKVLKQGLQIVADNCDGAIEQDGTGFAKNDLGYGNFLANTDPQTWINSEIYNACKLFRKYKKQHGLLNQKMEDFTSNILENDLSNNEIQEAKAKYQDFINQKYKRAVKEAKPVVKKLAQFFNNKAIIGFPYNQDLLTDLKVTCKTKKYNPENKTWELEILTETEYKALLSFLGKYEFEIEGEYIPLKSEELLNRFNGKVTYLSNTKLEISFFYDEELLKDLKKLDMFKKYNRENKTWEFFNLITDNVVKVVEFGKKWNLEIDTQILDFLEIQNKEVKEVVKVEGKIERLEKYQVKYPFASHYQLEALDWVIQKRKVYIGDTMGLGKAQSLDSKVLTDTGYKLMGELKVGDTVITEKGVNANIIGIYPQGLKDMYKCTFSDGSTTECCDEHLWNIQTPTMRYNNPDNFYTKELKDFKDVLIDKFNNKKWFIPITKMVNFETKLQYIKPYVLGVILGDGCISDTIISITKSDSELFEIIKQFLHKEVFLSENKNKEQNIITKSILSNIKGKNLYIRYLKHLGLLGCKSENKFIPNNYLLGDIDQRVELLQGLLDTDGYVSKDGYTLQYTSTSEQLINQVQFIIQSLGGTASLSSKIGSYLKDDIRIICRKAYTLNIKLPNNIIPFRLSRKLNRYKPKTKYSPYRAFKSVEYIGKKEAQCIKIDSDTHLYLTDNCIVTHNTLETLISIDYTDKKALVICPNSLKYNWGEEIKKFVKNRSYQILTSKNKTIDTIEDKDIYILNYDIIEKLLPVLKQINFDFLVLDEAHMVKESKTKRFKAMKELLETKNPEYRVLLSGTCITNRPKELVPQLEILGVLHKIVDKPWSFFMRYCGAYRTNFGWDMSGASHTQELHSKLTETCYIRREKEQVLKDLPEKRRNIISLEISNRKEYNQALNDLVTYLRQEKDKEINTNAQHLVQIEVLKQLVAKGKLEAIKEWIDNVLANDEKLVLFAHHKEIIAELKKVYPTALIIDGSTSIDDRQLAVETFQNNPNEKLIICSIKSASVGLTLTASSNVAFIELPWTPAELDQAEDRCHRRGQLNCVNAYYLLGNNTIEDSKIMPLIENKRAVFNAVARGEKVKRKDLESSILNDLVDSLIA